MLSNNFSYALANRRWELLETGLHRDLFSFEKVMDMLFSSLKISAALRFFSSGLSVCREKKSNENAIRNRNKIDMKLLFGCPLHLVKHTSYTQTVCLLFGWYPYFSEHVV